MVRLEDITVGAVLTGLLANQPVTVRQVQRFGDDVLSVTFVDRLPLTLTASRPILEDENGIPECVAQVRLYEPGAVCDPAHGYRDPPQTEGRPMIGGALRP